MEPARNLADEAARAARPVWLYRFAYVSQAQRGKNMGTLHGFESPVIIDIPAGIVGADKVMLSMRISGTAH